MSFLVTSHVLQLQIQNHNWDHVLLEAAEIKLIIKWIMKFYLTSHPLNEHEIFLGWTHVLVLLSQASIMVTFHPL